MRRCHPRKQLDHPTEEELLLLLAGELNSRDAEAYGIHLPQCRECLEKMRAFKKGFQVFGEYRQAAAIPAAGEPPDRWSGFRALLDRTAAADASPMIRRVP